MQTRRTTESGPESIPETEAEDLYEMANLFPSNTGLPMTVWVSPRGHARHDTRIKVHTTHGNRMVPADTVVVGARPAPHIVAGRLPPDDERAVFEWVRLNTDALVAYWEGQIDTIELGRCLQPIASAQLRPPAC